MPDHRTLAEALLPTVLRAGAETLRYFKGDTSTEWKDDGSPVTIADKRAQEILLAGLKQADGTTRIIAEEDEKRDPNPPGDAPFYLVDPLDGTKEFISGSGEYTINIARVEKGRPTFGIVYAPAINALYMTLAPNHAILADIAPQAGDIKLADLNARRITTRTPDRNALTIVASKSHGSPETDEWLSKYNVADRKNIGSSLKFCLVASGEADLYPRLGPTCEWDTGAGHAVLLAAGGTVVETNGAELLYGHTERGYLNPYFIAAGGAELLSPSQAA